MDTCSWVPPRVSGSSAIFSHQSIRDGIYMSARVPSCRDLQCLSPSLLSQFVTLLADWVEKKSTQGEIDIRELAEKRIIAQYSPPCVFLDDHYNILYFQGLTHKYLVQPSGKPTLNILKMARRELQAKLDRPLAKPSCKGPG